MELRLGAPMYAEDGRVARLGRIVFDPRRGEVVALVGIAGRWIPRDLVIPLARVRRATWRRIDLAGTVAEIVALPTFAMEQFVCRPEEWIPPPDTDASQYLLPGSPYITSALEHLSVHPAHPAAERLPPARAELLSAIPVFATDGRVGAFDGMATDEEGRALEVVVRAEFPSRRRTRVPLDRVALVRESGIYLRLSRAAYRGLVSRAEEVRRMESDAPARR